MASTVWNGSVDTDWNTAANWTPSGVPLASAHIQISTTNDCALDQTRSCASLTIDSGATLIGGGFTLNVTSEGDASSGTEDFAVKNDGIISAASTLSLNITTPTSTSGDFGGSSGKFHDVTVNHASCILNLESTTQFTGTLTITLGKIVCGGNTVEISEHTEIGPASGVADQATLQCDASAMFLGSGITNQYGLIINQGGTFTGGSGNHTLGGLKVGDNSNAKCTLTSANTTINGEHASDNYNLIVYDGATFDNADGTIILTGPTSIFYMQSSATVGAGEPRAHNLTVNSAGNTFDLGHNLTVEGDLTITAGTIDTTALSNRALTVAGATDVAGTLTLNGSTCSFGDGGYTGHYGLRATGASGIITADADSTVAMSSLYAADNAGINIALSGTNTINKYRASNDMMIRLTNNTVDSDMTLTVTTTEADKLMQVADANVTLILNASSGTPARKIADSAMSLKGLTITNGTLDTDSSNNYGLTVSGNTKVTGTLTGNNSTLIFGTDGVHSTVEAGGLWVEAAGSLTFGSGDLTAFSGFTSKGTEGSPNVTSTGGGDILIKGRTNNGFMNSHNHQGVNITGDYIIDYDNNAIFDNRGGTTIACGTFIIKHDGRTYEPWSNSGQDLFKIIGNMEIQDGTFDTEYPGQDSQHLTVTIALTGAGTLTGNASTITIGNFAMSGTYNATTGSTIITDRAGAGYQLSCAVADIVHNDGTFDFRGSSGGASDIRLNGASDGTNGFHDVIINASGRTVSINSYALTIDGNLTITAGTFNTSASNYALTVGGFIHGAGTLAANSSTIRIAASNDIQTQMTGVAPDFAASTGGINKFGFNGDVAFTGAMTVTCGSVGGNWTNAGTSTVTISNHNNKTNNQTGSLYNLTINNAGNTTKCSSTQTILGAFTITAGTFDMMNQVLTVTGTTSITGILDAHTNGDPAITLGVLSIETGGQYKATSGTTTLLGNFTDAGTFTHNNGTVSTAAGTAILLLGNSNTAFYDIKSASTGSGVSTFKQYTNKTVEHDMITGSKELQWQLNTNDVVLTLGTDSYASQIDADYFDGTVVANQYVQGASELYPAVFKSTIQFLRFTGHTGQGGYMATNAHIKNVDIQKEITTPADTKTLTLEGDCEFAAVNISAGDTLNLNGQRAEFNGAFDLTTSTSAIQMNDAMAVYNNTIDFNGRVPTSNTGTTIIHDPPSAGEKLITSLYFGGTFFAKGVESDVNGYAWGGSSGEYPAKIFVGGQLDCQQSVKTGHWQVATGGEVRGNDRTLTAEGDFTMSGGLIGKSALNLTGAEEVTGSDNLDEVATTNKFTIEAWFKASTDANYRAIFSRGTSWSTGNLYVYMNSDGNVQASANDLSNTLTSTTAGLADDKWHHVAYTYDTTTIKLYIDGKLEATAASTSGINTQTAGFKIGDRDGDNWIGNIGRVSVWKNALSETLIRKMFFMDWTTMAADSDFTDSDAIGWWQFDEGTGTAVEDLSSQSNDGTLNSAAWAGGGTFTYGTSTVDMIDDGTILLATGVNSFNNLKVAASGKTTTLSILAGASDVRFWGTLTHGGGTASSSGNPAWTMRGSSTVSAGSDWTGWYLCYWDSSAAVPASSWEYWLALTDSTLAGDMTCTGYFRPHQSVVNSGEYTITTYDALFHNTGGLNMGNGSLIFTHAQGLSATTSSSVFTAGPGATVTGVAGKSTFMSQNNFVVVGNIENLDVTNEELSILGNVTNCTGDIHRWNPTIDTEQMLDADTADDRDVRLGSDLDRNTELVT